MQINLTPTIWLNWISIFERGERVGVGENMAEVDLKMIRMEGEEGREGEVLVAEDDLELELQTI